MAGRSNWAFVLSVEVYGIRVDRSAMEVFDSRREVLLKCGPYLSFIRLSRLADFDHPDKVSDVAYLGGHCMDYIFAVTNNGRTLAAERRYPPSNELPQEPKAGAAGVLESLGIGVSVAIGTESWIWQRDTTHVDRTGKDYCDEGDGLAAPIQLVNSSLRHWMCGVELGMRALGLGEDKMLRE